MRQRVNAKLVSMMVMMMMSRLALGRAFPSDPRPNQSRISWLPLHQAAKTLATRSRQPHEAYDDRSLLFHSTLNGLNTSFYLASFLPLKRTSRSFRSLLP
jgi:hypothetical protein